MNSINPNFNNKYTMFKAEIPQQQEVQLPDLYYVPDDKFEPKSFKETVKEADMMGMIYPWIAHPFLMVGTCAGLAYGVDKFSKACGGDYEKSFLGKAAKLGDNIQNSRIAQSNTVKKFFNIGTAGRKKFNEITKNSDVINAVRNTPSMPEWGFVKDELLTQEQRVVHEFTRITDGLNLSGESGSGGFLGFGGGGSDKVSLKNLGLTREEKELVKNIATQEEAVNTVLLKRLGRSESEIQRILGLGEGATQVVKNEILNEMGLTADKLELIKKDTTGQYIKEVKAATEKVKGKVWIGAGNYSWMGPIQPFERRIGCDEIYNRLHSMSEGATTRTGRLMSKFLQRCHRGFTFGGGKLGVLMFVAPHLVETMLDAKKADPDAKVGTVANGVISAMSWVFTFPLGLKIMHSLTGAQYAGMTKDQVQEYRNLLNDFNKNVKSDFFKSKSEYDVARKELESKLKTLKTPTKPQNLLTKMCRKLGSFITMDLEQIKSYRNGTVGGNTARKIPSFFKNLGGVPIRLLLWGGITMGLLDTAITKGTKAIFGNFYDRMKEEEHEANKKKQKQFTKSDLQERMIEAQRKKLEPQIIDEPEAKIETQTPKEEQTPSSIEEKPAQIEEEPAPAPAVEQQVQKQQYIPNPNPNPELLKPKAKENPKRDNYTYMPSQNNVLQNPAAVQQNKYIPSQQAANIVKNFDNSGLSGALRRADRAEAKALQVLSGKFN